VISSATPQFHFCGILIHGSYTMKERTPPNPSRKRYPFFSKNFFGGQIKLMAAAGIC